MTIEFLHRTRRLDVRLRQDQRLCHCSTKL